MIRNPADLHTNKELWLLALRLFMLVVLVAALSLHMRSVKVFRWEQSVSGGVLTTYCIVALGLSLCSGGDEHCGALLFQVRDTMFYSI